MEVMMIFRGVGNSGSFDADIREAVVLKWCYHVWESVSG
jgi:hypothetical protein